MAAFDSIIGQDYAVATLTAFLTTGKLPHALIFSGISGTGKAAAATRVAMAANCRPDAAAAAAPPCGRCRICRNIEGDRHPDVHHLRPAGKMIKVDQIRQLRDIIAMKPYEADTRVVIIHDAHTMNGASANALLKSLEEPPPRTVFVLLTDQPGRLLPTVISRCQQVRFLPIDAEVIAARIGADSDLPPAEARLIAALSGGSMRNAEKMVDPAWRRHRLAVLGVMAAVDALPPGLLLAMGGHLAEAHVPVAETLSIIETWLRDVLVTATTGSDRLINVDLSDKIQYSARRTATGTILGRVRALEQARRRLDGNANVKLTMEHLLLAMARGAAAAMPTG